MSSETQGHDRLERLLETTRVELRRWTDAPGHDPGLAIAELLAYVGDTLSAYAEAIAGEAYLGSRVRGAHLEVTIDGERWQRVASLAESGPDEAAYVVTQAGTGSTVIAFGDGIHGRRPPADGRLRIGYQAGRRFASVAMQDGRVILDPDWNEPAPPTAGGA